MSSATAPAARYRWFDGKPELNWNVTGNFWTFPIRSAHYRLELPGGVSPLRWTAFTGRRGARGIDWRGAIGADGVLTVATTQTLAPSEGLTVVAELPAGSVEPPGPSTQLWYSLYDNRRWVFGALGFLVVLVYYFAAWEAVGRDPKRGTIIPLFHPPQGISPALANYIHNWGLTREKWRAFTAAALSLAVRRLIHFDEQGSTLTLTATGKQPEGGVDSLPPGERAIFSWVNVGGKAVIDKAHGEAVAKVGTSFTSKIEAECRNRFFRRNLGYVLAGLAMTAAVIFGVVQFGGVQDQDITILVLLGFGGMMLGIFLVPLVLALFGGGGFHVAVRSVMSLAVAVIFVTIFVNITFTLAPRGIDVVLPALWGFVAGYPFSFVLVACFATLNGLFFYLMRAPTALGRPVMDQLDGFKLYLETAEKDRLNMQAPEITADRFEALLPYAVALDVEKPWSEAFASALRRAHPEDADPMRHYQPTWHSGSSWSGGNFASAVSSTVAGVSGALASAVPVSSGSSGFSAAAAVVPAAVAAVAAAAAVAASEKGCPRVMVTSLGCLARQASSHRRPTPWPSCPIFCSNFYPRESSAHAGARRRGFEEDGHRPSGGRRPRLRGRQGLRHAAPPGARGAWRAGAPARFARREERPARRRPARRHCRLSQGGGPVFH